mgnify:CR=1 FL=1|jgi:hypothetical protein
MHSHLKGLKRAHEVGKTVCSMTVPVRFHLHALIECCTAGCATTGHDVNTFFPQTTPMSISSANDTALYDSVCTFLTNNSNWEAIKGLDFAKFESIATGGGLRLGSTDVLDIGGLLAALSSHAEQFAACWKCLIELCHCVLPAERHLHAQLEYVSSGGGQCISSQQPGSQPTAAGNQSPFSLGGGLDELLGGMLGNHGNIVSGLLNGTANDSDAAKLVSSVHSAVEPLINRLDEGPTKQGIQMIVQGLMALAQPSQPSMDGGG